MTKILREKLDEALAAVLPIVAIVLVLSLTVAPIPANILLAFLFGGVMLVVGMMLFSVGADMAMQPMGEKMGARITKTRKLWLILSLGFLLGFMITISEPDLQVLADQVQSIPNIVLIVSVGIGVGLFLVVALLRMLFGAPMKYLLLGFYALIFLLAAFAPQNFWAVAFDAGGVTTGPMTVPFIMAFGIGISAIRNDRHAATDSFGLIALCSIGPILSVLVLSLIYHPEEATYAPALVPDAVESVALGKLFVEGIPHYMGEIALALLPIAVFFGIFQVVSLRLKKKPLCRILVGILYTYVGLVLFLTGVNVGFSPAGSYLGGVLAGLPYRWIIVPIGMVIGYFIVRAEPAVYVLMTQVEELTDGAIAGKTLQKALSIGVSAAVGLALVASAREVVVLRDGWKFSREEHPGAMRGFSFDRVERAIAEPAAADLPMIACNFHKPDFKDAAWRSVRVPHDWGVEHAFLCDLPHLDAYLDVTGPGWYRTRFQVEGERWKVEGGTKELFTFKSSAHGLNHSRLRT